MTHNCEWLMVGGQPVADSTAQKTAREKLLVTRSGHPPDVGPPPRPVRMGFNHPEGTKDAFDHPGRTKTLQAWRRNRCGGAGHARLDRRRAARVLPLAADVAAVVCRLLAIAGVNQIPDRRAPAAGSRACRAADGGRPRG